MRLSDRYMNVISTNTATSEIKCFGDLWHSFLDYNWFFCTLIYLLDYIDFGKFLVYLFVHLALFTWVVIYPFLQNFWSFLVIYLQNFICLYIHIYLHRFICCVGDYLLIIMQLDIYLVFNYLVCYLVPFST
jgi:hypothetical protein